MSYRFDKLAQYVRGWMSYFGISKYYRPIPELDEWLRRRARMCYWNQWRWHAPRCATFWRWVATVCWKAWLGVTSIIPA